MSIREVCREDGGADRLALLSIIEKSENLTAEERDCAVELLDIYLGKPEGGDYLFIAASVSGVPVAYLCYGKTPLTDAVYDIYWILVHPDYRRKGVGTVLLDHTEGILRGLGARVIVAETSGLEGYEPARRFYVDNGFSEEARIRCFYKPGDDLVVFVKRL